MDKKIQETLRENLQLIENQVSISRDVLAKKFDVSPQTISNYWNGRPTIEFLLWLEDLTNIPIGAIYKQNLTPNQIKQTMNKKKFQVQNLFEAGEDYEKGDDLKNLLSGLLLRLEIVEKTQLHRAGHGEALETQIKKLHEEIQALKTRLEKLRKK